MNRFPVATGILIAICLLLALKSNFGYARSELAPFFISVYPQGLTEIQQGQWWRLVTPIFLHFGPIHLLFNMLWLWQLGGGMERRQGWGELVLMVAVIGVVSNLLQYLVSGPGFGGMSGVVYGMLGYFWMQGRYNPRFGMVLDKTIVAMMLIWFIVCWLGLVGNIANVAHTAGLLLGLAWGLIYVQLGRPA